MWNDKGKLDLSRWKVRVSNSWPHNLFTFFNEEITHKRALINWFMIYNCIPITSLQFEYQLGELFLGPHWSSIHCGKYLPPTTPLAAPPLPLPSIYSYTHAVMHVEDLVSCMIKTLRSSLKNVFILAICFVKLKHN